MKKPGIRTDLVAIWRQNIRNIFDVMHFTQADLATKMDRSRVSISNMMSNKDFHLTAIQFLGTMRGIKEMIDETDANERKKELAMEFWKDIDDEYLKNGLH